MCGKKINKNINRMHNIVNLLEGKSAQCTKETIYTDQSLPACTHSLSHTHKYYALDFFFFFSVNENSTILNIKRARKVGPYCTQPEPFPTADRQPRCSWRGQCGEQCVYTKPDIRSFPLLCENKGMIHHMISIITIFLHGCRQ